MVFLTKEEYTIKKSTIPKSGNGAYTNVDLKKGYTLGYYKGRKLNVEQYNNLKNDNYVWELSSSRGPFYIDGSIKRYSNWLRYVNHKTGNKANLEPYQYRGKMYYHTTKKIKAGSELFIDYGDDYWGH